jgi:RNA polymerase sigma-B factor
MMTGTDRELVQLVQTLPSGDSHREEACEALIARYQSIVRSCVHRYWDSPEPVEDLMQVGYLGLLKAIMNFNPEIGESLGAYAQPCVSGEIKRHFRDKRWQVRVRRSAQEMRLEIRSATAELIQQLAHSPSTAELASYLHVSPADVEEAQRADRVFQASSLDAPLGHDSTESLGDLMGEEDPLLQQTIDMESVWKHWEELPSREQRLLMMRFYGNMTQAQIGRQLGISQMHVSRLQSRALRYIRERLTDARPQTCP